MKYGSLPKSLGIHLVNAEEMFFYQYLPIKVANSVEPRLENRLIIFQDIIGAILCDFVGEFGLDRYCKSYVYVTAKNLYQVPNCEFNRPGWHSDGFLTDDINYIWCNNNPTTFNKSEFNLSDDHDLSLEEMDIQALFENNVKYSHNELLRLDQSNIHKVSTIDHACMRCFLKVSFSTEQYNLIGNSHNYLLDYNWIMKPRKVERNHPIAS